MYIKRLSKGYLGLLKEDIEMFCFEYHEMHAAMDILAGNIRSHPTPILQLFPITKGGDVPAVRLSHVLGEMEIIHREERITDDTFVLDEIIHSGRTLMELKEWL